MDALFTEGYPADWDLFPVPLTDTGDPFTRGPAFEGREELRALSFYSEECDYRPDADRRHNTRRSLLLYVGRTGDWDTARRLAKCSRLLPTN